MIKHPQQFIPPMLQTNEQRAIYNDWLSYFSPFLTNDTELLSLDLCVLYEVMKRSECYNPKIKALATLPDEFTDIFHTVCDRFQRYTLRPEKSIPIDYKNDFSKEIVGRKSDITIQF